MSRCDVFIASFSNQTNWPKYTFWRGDRQTTIDYVILDIDAAAFMSSFLVHDVDDLHTSDHLPISIVLDIFTDLTGTKPENQD